MTPVAFNSGRIFSKIRQEVDGIMMEKMQKRDSQIIVPIISSFCNSSHLIEHCFGG